ncbi:hypothetical protein [Actinoplanes sp. HUAS TT8]|uniref:hypothetical protein n=1 Tax=Actinoplanes sp. HUAS TT8 TaxID=3447453 RepID=UPI003F51CC21
MGRLLSYYLHSCVNAQVILDPAREPVTSAPPVAGVRPERPETSEAALTWFDGQRETLTEAVRLAAETGDAATAWPLAVAMQQYLQVSGHFQEWEDVMRVALPAARDSGDDLGEAHVLRGLAGARWSLGAGEESPGLLRAALRLFEKLDMPREQARTRLTLRRVLEALPPR